MKRQSGIALISVLFLVALLTLLASQLLLQSRQAGERTLWLQQQAQAYQYALGGEAMARQVLYDELALLKAEQLAYTPIPGPAQHFNPPNGEILMKLEDLQGRVNINNLGQDDLAALPRQFLTMVWRQPQLLPVIADWIDGDSVARAGGAEDDSYLNREIPRRAANRTMIHLAEIEELTGNAYITGPDKTLVATLSRATPMNVNTLKQELAPLISTQLSAPQLLNSQQAHPFQSIGEFLQANLTAGLEINPAHLTVTSNYFQSTVYARFTDWQQPLQSRFFLDPISGRIELIDRQLMMTISTVNPFAREASDESDIVL